MADGIIWIGNQLPPNRLLVETWKLIFIVFNGSSSGVHYSFIFAISIGRVPILNPFF